MNVIFEVSEKFIRLYFNHADITYLTFNIYPRPSGYVYFNDRLTSISVLEYLKDLNVQIKDI